MYSDNDGVASQHSEAVYQTRIRRLLFLTSLLAGLGFGASVINDKYDSLNSSTHLLSSLSWLLLLLHSLWLHRMRDCSSIYTAGLRGSILSTLTLVLHILGALNHTKTSLLQYGAALLLVLVQIFFPRRPDVFTPEGRLVDGENGSSAFYKYSMQWCVYSLRLAGKNVGIDRLPALDFYTRSKSQPSIVSLKTSLWNHIISQRAMEFIKQWALMLLRSMATFGYPYCIMKLLKSLESAGGSTVEAWLWLVGIGVSSVGESIIHYHLSWTQWSELGIPIRAQLIMSIFQKALRVTDSKHPDSGNSKDEKPDAINLISSDTLAFSKFTAVNHILPSSFVKFLLAVIFLIRLLGWQSTLVAITVTVASIPIHTMVIKNERETRKHLIAARDRKSKAVNEAMQALRQIKFHGLEAQWEDRINQFRQEELKHLRKSLIVSTIQSVWKLTAPLLVAAASVCTFAYSTKSISPSIIFPMINLLPNLQGTLGVIPMVFQDLFDARSNAHRMEEYLRRPEQNRTVDSSPCGQVVFRNASITWPTDEVQDQTKVTPRQFFLRDLNITFPSGELSIIHGQTGSGKTLLLLAILGEANLLRGNIEAPSMAEGQPVAFVAQTPWLQSTTLKDNVLFGSPLDQEKYAKVLNACALSPDLAALPKGDETQIGPKGVKLSGGQRARVALARALYSSAKLIVIDDIFSALDAIVSKNVLQSLTGDLCKGRTRILVTHQVSMCVPKTRYIVQVQNNTAVSSDSMEQAMIAPVPNVNILSSLPIDGNSKERTRPTTKVTRVDARSDLKVYAIYFTAAGGLNFAVAYLLGLVGKQFLGELTTWTLGNINYADSSSAELYTTVESHWLQKYVYMHLLSLVATVIWELLFNLHAFSGSVRASKTVFSKMTFHVLRMPLLWLDTISVGSMLKNFTVDTRMVDDKLLITLSEFADCMVKMIVIVTVGLYSSKYTSLLTLVFLFAGLQVGHIYIKARSTVKRADAEPTAAILEHFTSSSSGVSTIRAFGAVDRFEEQMHNHIDRLSVAQRHFWIFNRWLGLQMALIGTLVCTVTGMLLLDSSSIIDTPFVGFSLKFSMGLCGTLFKAVNAFGQLETFMDAAGAITAYSSLQTEDQGGIEVPEDWPSRGGVEVNELQASYSASLPLVLKGISFIAEPGQRIGIVGRTGAGKSSLALTLLRLIEPCGGSILVDGIDISTIKLHLIRSRIAFVPQDPVLFSGTVRSNLDYFQQIPEERLKDALRRVKLLAEEEGNSALFTLDSPISAGGANMSQGQRQLLCLARILVQDPSIVILDEATSAVDNETDRLIQETIQHQVHRTLIVVAHRLRTVASFDQVLVINGGQVAEAGKPADLLRGRGLFYNMVQDSGDKEFLTKAMLR